nr:virion protein US10 [Human alphaherpesvirus 1]
MIKRRGNVEIRVYYESVRTLRSRSHLKPSDRQQSPGHRVFPGSPGFRDHPENLGNPEYRELPETPGYRVTPGIHDNPGSPGPHAPPANHVRLAGLYSPGKYAPLASPDPFSPQDGAYARTRVGLHTAVRVPPTGSPTHTHLRHDPGDEPTSDASGLYPLDARALAHLVMLPADHRAFFRTVVEVSRMCAANVRDPPPPATGAMLGRHARLVHTQWLRANQETSPLWPWRTAAINFITTMAPRVQTHRHMHDLLMACAFWCCLTHASTCSYAGLYSTHCLHLFGAFGCGDPALTPPLC